MEIIKMKFTQDLPILLTQSHSLISKAIQIQFYQEKKKKKDCTLLFLSLLCLFKKSLHRCSEARFYMDITSSSHPYLQSLFTHSHPLVFHRSCSTSTFSDYHQHPAEQEADVAGSKQHVHHCPKPTWYSPCMLKPSHQ